jgi:hypothetical protein
VFNLWANRGRVPRPAKWNRFGIAQAEILAYAAAPTVGVGGYKSLAPWGRVTAARVRTQKMQNSSNKPISPREDLSVRRRLGLSRDKNGTGSLAHSPQ